MGDAGTAYLVDIILDVKEKPGAKLSSQAKSAGEDFRKVGGHLADGFSGAVEKVGSIVSGAAKVGLGAAVAGVTYGVLGLNQELETTQVSLAAVLNANNIGGGMAGAMGVAAGWVRQMKQDAKELPGEFSDLLGIVQSGAAAAFNAGMDVKGFERIAAQGMAAAKAMSVPIDQAGRELAMLLEGRAGAHNVFGTRLGIHAADMQGKNGEQRVKLLTDALGKFEPAIAVFGETMDAQSSTLIDNAKSFLTAATGPLFNRIKDTIVDINAWFTANEATTKRWATKIGDFLVDSFDKGKAIVLEYGPLLIDFIKNAKDEFLSIWQEAKPYLQSLGDSLKGFLSDPNAFDKIETILKLYIAAKVGGGAFAIGKDVGLLANGISGLLGGGGAAASTAAAGGEAIAGVGAAEGGVAALGISAGAAAAALGLLVGSVAIADHYAAQQQDREAAVRDNLVDMYVNASAKGAQFADGWGLASGIIDKSSQDYLSTVEKLRENSQSLADAYSEGVDKINTAIMNIAETSGIVVNMNAKLAAEIMKTFVDPETGAKKAATKLVQDLQPVANDSAKMAEERRKKGVGGKGGTTIHKVEITVSSNQAPNQIARDVFSEFVNERRYRTSSRGAVNFSAGR